MKRRSRKLKPKFGGEAEFGEAQTNLSPSRNQSGLLLFNSTNELLRQLPTSALLAELIARQERHKGILQNILEHPAQYMGTA